MEAGEMDEWNVGQQRSGSQVIEQAVGIVMDLLGVDAEDARMVLDDFAAEEGIPATQAASMIVRVAGRP